MRLKLLLVVVMILGLGASAWATPIYLVNGNTGLTSVSDLSGYAGPYAEVTINAINLNSVQVTFTGETNVSYLGHVFDFYLTTVGLNATQSLTPTSISTSPAKTYEQGGTGNIDGFGNYNIQVKPNGSQGAPSAVQSVTFDLPSFVFSQNNKGFEAAAHIVVFEHDKSAPYPTGDAANGSYTPPVGPPPSVPEPSTLMLMGAGLLGLGLFRKRS